MGWPRSRWRRRWRTQPPAHRPSHQQRVRWPQDTALHTFTFANAMHRGVCALGGAASGVFGTAMSIYLNRFLNIPATHSTANGQTPDAAANAGRTARAARPPAAG
ncbi:MAG: hypothetical protein R2838_01780 [Caldilineaceae bacterium]